MEQKIGIDFKKFAISNGAEPSALEYFEKTLASQPIVNLTPNVVDERNNMQNSIVLDVFSRLIRDRIIFLGSGIDQQVAAIVSAQLLYLDMADSKKDINLYVSSPGGSVSSGLAIIDTMDYINCKVATTALDCAASMGFMLLCCGHPGHRSALQSTRIMAHQVSGGGQGTYSDMKIRMAEMDWCTKKLYGIISERCGMELEEVYDKLSHGDVWMSPEEAKAFGKYGAIDNVVGKNKEKYKDTYLAQ